MADEVRAEVGEILAGRYEVVGLLGEGSMGVVYDAVHRAIGRSVAFKTLREDLGENEELVQRFQMEARAAGSLGHPNIVQILDAGRIEGGAHFLVMERIDGGSLADVIGEGPVAFARVVDLGAQVLAGLGAAHRRGIVHRDLKPENILVTTDEEGREVAKVADFGISKVLDPTRLGPGGPQMRATEMGQLLGTPLYMSPEQARGLTDVDARTDLWAVGCVLYEMVCGRPPFLGENYAEILTGLMTEPPVTPSMFRPDIPPALEAVILAALAKDRRERPADAAAMRTALLAALGRTATVPTAQMTAVPRADDASLMIDALSRGVAAEIDAGNAAELTAAAPAAEEAPARPSAPPIAREAERPRPAPAAPVDSFAPPDDHAAMAALDIDHGARAPRTSATVAATSAQVPVPRAAAGSAMTTSVARGGGSFGRVLVVLVLLALVGGGGFLGYRYLTLGYLFKPPGAAGPATLEVRVSPAGADVKLDGATVGDDPVELAAGAPHVLVASAAGRLPVRVSIAAPRSGGPLRLVLRLPSALAPLPAALAPPGAIPEDASGALGNIAAVDQMLGKLAAVDACATRMGPVVAAARASFKPGRDAKAPQLELTGIEQCRSDLERSVSSPPSVPSLERTALAYGKELAEVEAQSRRLATYYAGDESRGDGGAFGRRGQRTLADALAAADQRGAQVAALLHTIRDAWQARELALLEESEGAGAHLAMRGAALAARRMSAAGIAGDRRAADAARPPLDAALASARTAAGDLGASATSLVEVLAAAPAAGADRAAWSAWDQSMATAFNRIEIRSSSAPRAATQPQKPGEHAR